MNICFVIDPWEELDPVTNTTLSIIHEAMRRGHQVALLRPRNLTVRDSITHGFVDVIERRGRVSPNRAIFYRSVRFKHLLLPMADFDVIFLLKNPPLQPLTLNFLDSVRGETFIMNDIDGIRKANNKLYLASSEKLRDLIPATHVSKNKEFLFDVISSSAAERMILKPLDGFGGSGVIILERQARHSIKSLLEFYINGRDGKTNYVILQEYIDGAEKGDVRIMMLNGEPIGALKRIPGPDEFRSNVHQGATIEKHNLSDEEVELCRRVGPQLLADGIYYTGLDVISGKLVEVNVQSPGGIPQINSLDRVRLQEKVLQFVEAKHQVAVTHRQSKRKQRKAVEDA